MVSELVSHVDTYIRNIHVPNFLSVCVCVCVCACILVYVYDAYTHTHTHTPMYV